MSQRQTLRGTTTAAAGFCNNAFLIYVNQADDMKLKLMIFVRSTVKHDLPELIITDNVINACTNIVINS